MQECEGLILNREPILHDRPDMVNQRLRRVVVISSRSVIFRFEGDSSEVVEVSLKFSDDSVPHVPCGDLEFDS